MRPVSNEFPDSQQFGEGATAGVAPSWTPDTIGWYVRLYGNYQEFGHAGKDIACPIGTPIYAPADGTVLYSGWTEDLPGTGNIRKWLFYYNFGGIITVIQHNGWISAIAHQSDNDAVHVGMQVKEGQLIGKSGNTKTRTTYVAPHVHIEALVYLDYRTDVRNGIIYGRVDPTQFFGGLAAQGTITEGDILDMANEDQLNRLLAAADRINGRMDDVRVLNAADGAYMNNARDAQYATIMDALGKTLNKSDGGYIVSLIEAVKPGATDAQAVATALLGIIPQGIAKQVADELSNRLKG
jgi:hypothetical protein